MNTLHVMYIRVYLVCIRYIDIYDPGLSTEVLHIRNGTPTF